MFISWDYHKGSMKWHLYSYLAQHQHVVCAEKLSAINITVKNW